MDKTRAAARQANAMQKLAEQLPAITDRLAAIEQQLAAPVEASAELIAIEPPATAAQIAEISRRLDELFISLMPAVDLAQRLDGLVDQLAEIKTLLAQRQPAPQNQRR